MSAVAFEAVDIVFGDKPRTALPLMEQGLSREQILAETGQVLGVSGCTLAVEKGQICVLMGLSGSGKSTLLRAVNGLNKVVRGAVRVDDGSPTLGSILAPDRRTEGTEGGRPGDPSSLSHARKARASARRELASQSSSPMGPRISAISHRTATPTSRGTRRPRDRELTHSHETLTMRT